MFAIVDKAILYLDIKLATEHIDLANSKTHVAIASASEKSAIL